MRLLSHLTLGSLLPIMVTPSTQIIVLPDIPELYEDNFLDILLPVKGGSPTIGRATTTTPAAVNPVIEALIENSRRTFTENGAPAYNSTNSAILDAFNNLSTYTPGSDVTEYLSKSWIEDPELTLRLIWTLRSIPDGKGLKETFYRYVYIVLDRSVFLHTFPFLKTGRLVGYIKTTPELPSPIFISWLNPFVLLPRKASRPRPMAAGKIFLTYFALLHWTSSASRQQPSFTPLVWNLLIISHAKAGRLERLIHASNNRKLKAKNAKWLRDKFVPKSLLITTKFLSANFLSPNSVRFTSWSHVYSLSNWLRISEPFRRYNLWNHWQMGIPSPS